MSVSGGLVLGQEARLLGHGGVRAVARVAGVSEATVRSGVFELEAGGDPLPGRRVRRPGGGRRPAEDQDPQLVPALLSLVEPDERGDPVSPLRWTVKSLRTLAGELTRQGHPVSAPTVGRLLRGQGFSLQASTKTLEGRQHPDRDAQFRYISEQAAEHQAAGQPVSASIRRRRSSSGSCRTPGGSGGPAAIRSRWRIIASSSLARRVPHVIPYGIYDLVADRGWVNVGVDHDTSAFAVASIRRWWQARGRGDYPSAARLLITADAGGSNSYRYRMWKSELAGLAAETGLAVTVCHFPPGTSKWNKIEHRLFSHITMNWRGRPPTGHEVVISTIAATRTSAGLRVEAALDARDYSLGVSVSAERMSTLPIAPHAEHGAWDYTIHPASQDTPDTGGARDRDQGRARALDALADPRLTGMSRDDLSALTAALAPAQAARAEQRRFEQRGGPRCQARGRHGRALLTDAARIVITVIYQRQVCSQQVLAEMLEVSQFPVGQAITETSKILAARKHAVAPAVLRFSSTAALRVRARTRDGAVACPGCGAETARVHEYRERTAADVPVDGPSPPKVRQSRKCDRAVVFTVPLRYKFDQGRCLNDQV